ncbi:MAG: GNAT family N-acetyltransferase [Clostridiales bacterium]|nr:GNAT family N-acetyltransferase [Clostridiales bacterium]
MREKLEGLQYLEVENRGEEFTEEIYKEFFMGSDLELIGAFADGKLVGIIEWNHEENDFLEGKSNSVNVGEIYVYPAYRGTGLSETLLRFAENISVRTG